MAISLPAGVSLDRGNGGLVRLAIDTPSATGELHLLGAHVSGWRPRAHPHPVLWMSGRSWFEPGRPHPGGGVPICFPWFGLNSRQPGAPAHGIARIQPWHLDAVSVVDDSIVATLSLASNEMTSLLVEPAEFELRFEVAFGPVLVLSLTVVNTGQGPMTFEEALHTYLTVGDVRDVRVRGLAGAEDHDKTDGCDGSARKPHPSSFPPRRIWL